MAPFVRKEGKILPGSFNILERSVLRREFRELLNEREQKILERDGEVNLTVPFRKGYRLRGQVFRTNRGLSATFRLFPPAPLSLDDLNLPPAAATLTTFPEGLILVSGPARSGISTTIGSMLKLMNVERRLRIVCLEESVEFLHESDLCSMSQRQIGLHTLTYQTGLNAIFRERADVVVMGELLNQEAIKQAFFAAQNGLLVIGTMNSYTASAAINRLLSAFPESMKEVTREILADFLRGVLCQSLVNSTNGTLVPVVELLFNIPSVTNCIRQDKLHELPEIMRSGLSHRMSTREDSINDLFRKGLISKEVCRQCHEEESLTQNR